jgi:hypothetical protein
LDISNGVPRRIVVFKSYSGRTLNTIYSGFLDSYAYHNRALSEQDFDRSRDNLQKSGMVREYSPQWNVPQDLSKLTASAHSLAEIAYMLFLPYR